MVPRICVITPTRNVMRYLHRFFEAINKLDYPTDRLIWVFADGESTDGTFDWLKKNKIKFKKIVITKKKSTRPSARNEAYKYIRDNKLPHDFISTVDADVLLYPDFFTRLLKHFKDKRVGMVASYFMYEDNKFLIDYTNSYLGGKLGKVVNTGSCPTGCAIFRKEVFDFFDETFICHEDGDLAISITNNGWKGLQDFTKTCPHLKDQTTMQELKELYGMGYYEPLLWMKHPSYFKNKRVFFGSMFYLLTLLSVIPSLLAIGGYIDSRITYLFPGLVLFSALVNSITIRTGLLKRIPYGLFTTVRFLTYYTAFLSRLVRIPFQKIKFNQKPGL